MFVSLSVSGKHVVQSLLERDHRGTKKGVCAGLCGCFLFLGMSLSKSQMSMIFHSNKHEVFCQKCTLSSLRSAHCSTILCKLQSGYQRQSCTLATSYFGSFCIYISLAQKPFLWIRHKSGEDYGCESAAVYGCVTFFVDLCVFSFLFLVYAFFTRNVKNQVMTLKGIYTRNCLS